MGLRLRLGRDREGVGVNIFYFVLGFVIGGLVVAIAINVAARHIMKEKGLG